MNLEIIRIIRQNKKISLGELSKRTGINAETISLIERNKTNPAYKSVYDIVKALDLELRILLKE